MGSKGSYAGGGGNIGNDLREGIDDWLANLPGSGGAPPAAAPGTSQPQTASAAPPTPKLTPRAQRVARTSLLFKTTSGAGSKARRGTEVQFPRSAATSSRIAGRGAAAAYAYRTGDRDTLRDLGLDYDTLRANPNVLDVVYVIAQVICDELPQGTIDTDEQVHVVAEIAEWVVTADPNLLPTPAEIAQETLAVVMYWAYFTTTEAKLNTADLSAQQREVFEKDVRGACEELAAYADLNPSRPTADQFTSAVETGIEFLQTVYGGSDV
ncbi:hypothetical protein [Cellulosimicrobium sp. RS]|uniref:hypothetical protein n=1 Tax=Cellulosimicrobium sp. RS TaxID=3381347 RepID=UPI0038FD33C2